MDTVTFVKELLEKNYKLGSDIRIEPIKAGDTNNSFFAWAKEDGVETKWYVRQYNPAEKEQDIIYEHAFEKYFDHNVNGEIQTMLPVESKTGNTWVVAENGGQSNFYAVFNIISGREPWFWEYNDMTDEAMDACAKIVAQFQSWAYGFEGPEGSGKREPPLGEQFKRWRTDLLAAYREKAQDKVFQRFTEYLGRELSFLFETIDFCEAELNKYGDALKICINHKDLNPGNVMFDEDDNITAVFDLDWVNIDYRIYDLAWMGYQAIASWDTDSWGVVPIYKLKRFVEIYNQEIVSRNCPLGPLNEEEKKFLPSMMIIGAMKVIMDFTCYEEHAHDVHRLFVNTWRFVESVRFMRKYVERHRFDD